MKFNKPQYKKMDIEQLVILSQENDYKAIEELVKREQKIYLQHFHIYI